MSKIEQIISEIEEYLDGCKPQAFSGSKKIIVEKDVIDEMLVELRMSTPEEIKKYQKIIASKDAIMADAQQKADVMIADAQRESQALVDQSEVVQLANRQARDIVEEAQSQAQAIIDGAVTEANAVREGAMNYTDSALKNLQTIISHSMDDSKARFDAYLNQMRSSYDVITANRRELGMAAGEAAEEEEEPLPDIAISSASDDDDFAIDLPLGE